MHFETEVNQANHVNQVNQEGILYTGLRHERAGGVHAAMRLQCVRRFFVYSNCCDTRSVCLRPYRLLVRSHLLEKIATYDSSE